MYEISYVINSNDKIICFEIGGLLVSGNLVLWVMIMCVVNAEENCLFYKDCVHDFAVGVRLRRLS